jgi:hypothetical protein
MLGHICREFLQEQSHAQVDSITDGSLLATNRDGYDQK